jgi:NAD(P)H-nitrite reductase large subunit
MRYVIIGCSYAAVAAVEALRQVDETGEIVVVADEPHGAYCRPLLPHYIEGEMSLEEIYYRPPEFFSKMGVETRLGLTVKSIDSKRHKVFLADGEALSFDRLLISTGGKPTIPPTPGSDAHGVFTLTRLDDARRISAWVEQASVRQAVIIGAGLICLNTLRALTGIKITLVELLPRVMGLALDDEASSIIEQRLKEHGIDVRTGTTVSEILRDDDAHSSLVRINGMPSHDERASEKGPVRGVKLSSGAELTCQMVLFAVGVRPNFALLEGSEIAVQRGIPVDEHMQTSVPDIYAAGDVAEAYDLLNDERRVIAILSLAYEQGRIAGLNMAGRATRYAGGIALNSMSLFDLSLMTMGITLTDNRPDLTALVHRADGLYRKLIFRGDALVGAILIGDVASGGVLTSLVKSGRPITLPRERLLRGDLVEVEVAREATATRKIGAWARPTI